MSDRGMPEVEGRPLLVTGGRCSQTCNPQHPSTRLSSTSEIRRTPTAPSRQICCVLEQSSCCALSFHRHGHCVAATQAKRRNALMSIPSLHLVQHCCQNSRT